MNIFQNYLYLLLHVALYINKYLENTTVRLTEHEVSSKIYFNSSVYNFVYYL